MRDLRVIKQIGYQRRRRHNISRVQIILIYDITHLQKILWTTALLVSVTLSEGRRVRVKTIASTEEPAAAAAQAQPPRQVLFYAEEPQERSEEEAPAVIIARPSFHRQSGGGGGQHLASRARQESAPKSPPVQTIRNYNKINDDGSFTFGYEAADGSFKEETRGTDCVVRGKYGYVDPDGNKREFTYVSGNPCDPNSISQEEEDELKDKSNEDENIPANIPRRPNFASRPLAVTKSRPTTTYFQQSFNNDNSIQDDDSSNQLIEIKQPARPLIRPGAKEDEQLIRTTGRPLTRVTIPASTRFATAAATRQQTVENQPATTYRPQIVQLAVTPSPANILPKTTRGGQFIVPSSTSAPSAFFDEQFRKFQLSDGRDGSPSPSPQATLPKGLSSNPVYSTELVYDPASGQYNTIVYQQVPKFGGEISLNQRLPSFVPSPQAPPPLQNVAPARFLVSTTTPAPTSSQQPFFQQQIIEQQRQAALVQQSQQLYNQQLRQQQLQQQQQRQFVTVSPPPPPSHNFGQPGLLKQNPHRFPQPIVQRFPPEPKQFGGQEAASAQFQQPFYYLNPSVPDQRQNLAAGQIEAFLRGHNLQF